MEHTHICEMVLFLLLQMILREILWDLYIIQTYGEGHIKDGYWLMSTQDGDGFYYTYEKKLAERTVSEINTNYFFLC